MALDGEDAEAPGSRQRAEKCLSREHRGTFATAGHGRWQGARRGHVCLHDVLARGFAAWLDGKAGGLDLGGAADRDGTPDTFTLTEAETMAQEILAEAFAGGVPETRREAGREPRRRYAPGEDAGDDRAALRGAGKTAMAYGFLRSRSIPIGITETAAIVRARTGHGLWPGNGPHGTRADAAESVFNGVAKTLGTAYRLQ